MGMVHHSYVVSIQLLLRFYLQLLVLLSNFFRFNTTLVKVLSLHLTSLRTDDAGFNTTLVKVLFCQFESLTTSQCVSIQLLLRFYEKERGISTWIAKVSIQLLLRFYAKWMTGTWEENCFNTTLVKVLFGRVGIKKRA